MHRHSVDCSYWSAEFCILRPLDSQQAYAVIYVMTPVRIIGLGGAAAQPPGAGELGQSVLGRHASIGDIVSNTSGLLAGTMWLLSWNQPRLIKGALRMAAPVIILLNVQAPIRSMIDCWQQVQSFPVLASFERPLELGSWGAKDSEIPGAGTGQLTASTVLRLR